MISIGVDAGGTSTRVGLVDESGNLLHVDTTPTRNFSTPEEFVRHVVGVISKMAKNPCDGQCDDVAIGVAVAGTLDGRRESVVRSVNLPFLEGYALRQSLADELHAHVVLMTDAEAATWGEYSALSSRPDRFVHLRLGTGVACGVVINHKLLRLDADRAGHLDCLIVDRSATALSCQCGKSGCLETIASAPAITRESNKANPGAESKSIPAALRRSVVDGVAEALAIAMTNLVTQFRPNTISLGGGVIDAWPQVADAAMDTYQRTESQSSVAVVELIRAALGDHAGVIGAARVAGADRQALATTP